MNTVWHSLQWVLLSPTTVQRSWGWRTKNPNCRVTICLLDIVRKGHLNQIPHPRQIMNIWSCPLSGMERMPPPWAPRLSISPSQISTQHVKKALLSIPKVRRALYSTNTNPCLVPVATAEEILHLKCFAELYCPPKGILHVSFEKWNIPMNYYP